MGGVYTKISYILPLSCYTVGEGNSSCYGKMNLAAKVYSRIGLSYNQNNSLNILKV